MAKGFYKYGFIDLSYVLSRNMFSVANHSKTGFDYTPGDLVRVTIQTINKICRDYNITADKFIFLRDTWDKELGGYYRTSLLPKGEYKGDRGYMTQELFEEIQNNPESTPTEIEDARKELYRNETKTKAKWILIRDIADFGIPTLEVPGWEADDLAYLATNLLMEDPDPKKSVIITKDSDILYSLSPKVDYFKIPTGGSKPQVITYDQMWYDNERMPEVCRNMGMSLYTYHAIWESIGEGHNNMARTRKNYADPLDTIIKCYNNDFSNLEDIDLYLKHMKTFNLLEFPHLDEAKQMFYTKVGTCGNIGSVEEFRTFCEKKGINGISDSYYSTFVGRLDKSLYTNG